MAGSLFKLSVRAAKEGFFDREKVLKAVGRARVKVLSKAGALVRKTAQKSLKYGEGSSPPGQPPTAHKTGSVTRKSKSTGKTRVRRVSYLREFLFFAYDKSRESVVVGPARLNGVASRDIPAALEHGGTTTITTFSRRKGRRPGERETRRVSVKARPFMRPALAQNQAQINALWRDSIR